MPRASSPGFFTAVAVANPGLDTVARQEGQRAECRCATHRPVPAAEAAEALRDVQGRLLELIEEAKGIVAPFEDVAAMAEAYWLAQLTIAATNDNEFLGGAGTSLDDTIAALEDFPEAGAGHEAED